MSTRAIIIIKDEHSQCMFYRHSDGYPEGTMPTLEKFLDLVKEGKIRDNTSQAAGWLVILGMQEYASGYYGRPNRNAPLKDALPTDGVGGWKVGVFEPISQDDVGEEFTYLIDLLAKTITHTTVHEEQD